MRVPKAFELRGKQWQVAYKWNLTYRQANVFGLCDFDLRTIWIDRSLSREDKFWTFLHEYLHAVMDEHGVGQHALPKSRAITSDQEEDIIHAIEQELRAHFRIRWAVKP